ncbi:MAG: hypothetical protein ACR2JQ_06145 [Mycobacteriales bacterium]
MVVLDLAAAQAFYGTVFGWTFTPVGDDHVLITAGDEQIGAFGKLSPAENRSARLRAGRGHRGHHRHRRRRTPVTGARPRGHRREKLAGRRAGSRRAEPAAD